MLTKYKDVRPKKDVNSPLKNVFIFHICGILKNFFTEGHQNLTYFLAYYFFSRIIVKQIENKKGFGADFFFFFFFQ